jgi:hypothetical protein
MKYRDPKLFFLTMEVVIPRPGRDGLTKKTLVLEEDSRPAELASCNPWGECRFALQMRKGGLVKIHDSVLMEESQYKCLLISEDTTVEEVVRILLYCYGLEQVERPERYCLYEQCAGQRYQRRLAADDRPLAIQSLWPGTGAGGGQFSFVLRRSLPARESLWAGQRLHKSPAGPQQQQVNTSPGQKQLHINSPGQQLQQRPSPGQQQQQVRDSGQRATSSTVHKVTVATSTRLRRAGQPDGDNRNNLSVLPVSPAERTVWSGGPDHLRLDSPSDQRPSGYTITVRHVGNGEEEPDDVAHQTVVVTGSAPLDTAASCGSSSSSSRGSSLEEAWPELDKDSEEQVSCSSSSAEDMDTSLSSNDSPTPPMTSTPLAAATTAFASKTGGSGRIFGVRGCAAPSPFLLPPVMADPAAVGSTPPARPSMAFLFPSPDYATFPSRHIPCRPYSALSTTSSSSCQSLRSGSHAPSHAPSLPPKPASLAALFSGGGQSSSGGNSSCHDYENYFYI